MVLKMIFNTDTKECHTVGFGRQTEFGPFMRFVVDMSRQFRTHQCKKLVVQLRPKRIAIKNNPEQSTEANIPRVTALYRAVGPI